MNRQKIGQIKESLILVRLYEAARTYFIANSWFEITPQAQPRRLAA